MKKYLLAIALLVGITGIAMAQPHPQHRPAHHMKKHHHHMHHRHHAPRPHPHQ